MARPRGARGWGTAVLAGAGAVTLILLAACSYRSDEPGLFGRDAADSSAGSERPRPRLDRSRNWPDVPNRDSRTNPELPVIGEELWTTGDGTGLTVRIGVHAVRRIAGATVLDWSVTPLGAPGLRADDVVPPTVDLGLHRFDGGNTNLFLIDPGRRELYRPLVHRNISRRCLCTPIWRAQRALRIGQTALLQVGFPELPPDVSAVDVDIATVPVFSGVAVTPIGEASTATEPTDLHRAPEPPAQPDRRVIGTVQHRGQRFRIEVARLVAREEITSLQWVITSLDPGPGLETADGPPFADPELPISYNTIAASGPRLQTGGSMSGASLVSGTLTSDPTVECLCSDLRIWAKSLQAPGHEATVITNFPALPAGVEEVTVRFAGVGEQLIPVGRGADSARSGPPQPRRVGYWQERDLPASWSPLAWPTDLPDGAQLVDYLQVRDRILR